MATKPKKPKTPKLIPFTTTAAVRRPDGSLLEYLKVEGKGYYDKELDRWVAVEEHKEIYVTEQQFYDEVIGPICRQIERCLPPGSTATYVPGTEKIPWKTS